MVAVKAMLNNEHALNAAPLNVCDLLVDFISTHALSGRSENDRNEKISVNFIRHLKSIGPNGMKASCNVLNKGKMTKNGRLRCSGCVAHKNPLFSLEAVKGMNLFYRFNLIGEVFPDFLDPKDFLLRPMIRSETNPAQSIGHKTQNNMCHNLHKLIGFIGSSSKWYFFMTQLFVRYHSLQNAVLVTHQGRAQSQREMFDADISLDDIKCFSHYLHDAQTESHIANLAVQCIANRSGCKIDEMHLHLPEWIATDVPISTRKAAAPWLCKEKEKISVEVEKCANVKELKTKCLITAMGCLDAVELFIVRFMQFSASHLNCCNMKDAELDELPIHLRFSHPVFSHHFFRSVEFQSHKIIARKNENDLFFSAPAINPGMTIGTSVGNLSNAVVSEILLHKKLDKIDKNLALIAMNTSCKCNNGRNDAFENWSSSDLHHSQMHNEPAKSFKKSRFEHFSDEIRNGNSMLHHMAKGLTTMRELWIEYAVGINGGPALRDLEKKHGSQWRNDKSNCGNTAWSRRLAICQEIESMIQLGMHEHVAVNQLEIEMQMWCETEGRIMTDVAGFNKYLRNRTIEYPSRK